MVEDFLKTKSKSSIYQIFMSLDLFILLVGGFISDFALVGGFITDFALVGGFITDFAHTVLPLARHCVFTRIYELFLQYHVSSLRFSLVNVEI